MSRYLTETLTPAVLAAQDRTYGKHVVIEPTTERDDLGPDEAAFLAQRDSFYMSTVGADGWPYLQHRGGPPGFVKVLDAHTLGFADYRGNRQLITVGNLDGANRAALMFMDYPNRRRLKVLGHARVLVPADHRELAEQLAKPEAVSRKMERLIVIEVIGFNWNCPAYITPRYTEAEIAEIMRTRMEP
jgi:uncharacterized protein